MREVSIAVRAMPARASRTGEVPARPAQVTVTGDTVNVASRLEAMTRELSCTGLISHAVADAVREEAAGEAGALLAGSVERGEVHLKGRAQPVAVLAYGKGGQSLKP